MKQIKQAYSRARNTYITTDGKEVKRGGSRRVVEESDSDDERTDTLTRKEAKYKTDWKQIKMSIAKNVKSYKKFIDHKTDQLYERMGPSTTSSAPHRPSTADSSDEERKQSVLSTSAVESDTSSETLDEREVAAMEEKIVYYEKVFQYSLRQSAPWVTSPNWKALERPKDAVEEMEALDLGATGSEQQNRRSPGTHPSSPPPINPGYPMNAHQYGYNHNHNHVALPTQVSDGAYGPLHGPAVRSYPQAGNAPFPRLVPPMVNVSFGPYRGTPQGGVLPPLRPNHVSSSVPHALHRSTENQDEASSSSGEELDTDEEGEKEGAEERFKGRAAEGHSKGEGKVQSQNGHRGSDAPTPLSTNGVPPPRLSPAGSPKTKKRPLTGGKKGTQSNSTPTGSPPHGGRRHSNTEEDETDGYDYGFEEN